MKAILSTVGRFHMFALARELNAVGALDRIYSGFNWGALKRERLPRSKVKTFPMIRPAMMAWNQARLPMNPWLWAAAHQASVASFDRYVASSIRECDLFVGHEASGLISGKTAQRRGAKYVCDRGCSHVAYREALIEEEYSRCGIKSRRIKPLTYEREISEYEACDMIVVPSSFSANSFIQNGICKDKIVMIPYGVDLSVFDAADDRATEYFDVVFCGSLSLRKGAKDLFSSFDLFDVGKKRLILIGTIDEDVRLHFSRFLQRDDVLEMGHQPHSQLRRILAKSHALVLPSIEDGFGMVLAEALACGCPIVATEHTGAPDLITDGLEGYIVPIRSPELIAERLSSLIDRYKHDQMSHAAREKVHSLGGWSDYGSRMINAYQHVLS